jgi:diacylglycerol kinase (ATP)
MKFAKLLHNPGAGDRDMSKKDLISMIQSAGFGCSYSSTKDEGWEKLESKEIDFIILAGGDGTIRRVSAELLKRRLIDRKLPIAVLPMGTANNIAKTLGIYGKPYDEIIKSWSKKHLKDLDVGRIYGVPKSKFFLESIGFGIFPQLMEKMEKASKKDTETPDKSLQTALEVARDLIMKAEAKFCKITIDGVEHKGNYLLVEIMNTTSIGPRLNLAPLADPGDGYFDIVLISEREREQFADYVAGRLEGREQVSFYQHLRARKLEIFWDGSKAHVDDVMVELRRGDTIEIELLDRLLEFFVTEERHSSY